MSLRADRSFLFLLLRHVPLRRGWGGGRAGSWEMGWEGMGTSTLFSHFLHLSSPLFTYFTILHLISPLTPPSLTFLHLLSPLFSPLYSTITRSLYLHLSSPLSSPFFTIHKPTPHWDDNKNLNTPQVSARTSHEVKRASNSPSTPATKQTLFPHGHTNGTNQ